MRPYCHDLARVLGFDLCFFLFFDNKQHQLSKIAQISQHSDIVELTIVPLSSLE